MDVIPSGNATEVTVSQPENELASIEVTFKFAGISRWI